MKGLSKKVSTSVLVLLLAFTCISNVFAANGGSSPENSSPENSSPENIPGPVIPSNPDVIVPTDTDSSDNSNSSGTIVTNPYVTNYVAADGTVMVVVVPARSEGVSGTMLRGAEGILPSGATLAAASVTSGETYSAVAALVTSQLTSCEQFFVFSFDITANGTVVHQLDGYVKVTIDKPADLVIPAGKELHVYRVEEDGVTLTRCECAVNGNSISFLTNHFSNYVFAVEDATAAPAVGGSVSPKTGE